MVPDRYASVGEALLVAIERHVDRWEDADRTAWTELFQLEVDTMLEGARVG